MPAISFSATEILSSLLSKEKTQTIRPLGKKVLKIGDIVTMYWKQRSQYPYFCKCHGDCLNGCPDSNYENSFSKMLGKGMITDVFEIEMMKETIGMSVKVTTYSIRKGVLSMDFREMKNLAQKDGFDDENAMFKWFDAKYDLQGGKRFIVYRWEWLDES